MTTRSDLHALVDKLEDGKLEEARTRLEFLHSEDPLLKLLNEAPYDDEPYTDEEQRQVEEADRSIERGEWVSLSDFEKSLGDEHPT